MTGIDKVCNQISGFHPLCIIEQHLLFNLNYFTARLSQYQQSLTNQPPIILSTNPNRLHSILTQNKFINGPSAINYQSSTTARPFSYTPPPITYPQFWVNSTSTIASLAQVVTSSPNPSSEESSETVTTVSSTPFDSQESGEQNHPRSANRTDMSSFEEAQETFLGSNPFHIRNGRSISSSIGRMEEPILVRSPRQAELLGLAVGYLGAKLFNYIDPPSPEVNYREMYTALKKNVDTQSQQFIQLGHSFEFEHHEIERGLAEIHSHLSMQMSFLTSKFDEFKTSLNAGLLRVYLLIARLSEDTYRLLEMVQYDKILSDCMASRLSMAAIEPKSLAEQLKLKQAQLSLIARELVISPETLSPYYHHALARCSIHQPKGQIDIQMDLPIKHLGQEVRIAEIFSVPFFHTAPKAPPQLCHLAHSHDNAIILDGVPFPLNLADSTHCTLERGICQYFPYSTTATTKVGCIRALLGDGLDVNKLQEACPFHCRTTDLSTEEVSVIKLGWVKGFYQYAITLPPVNSVVKCYKPNNHKTYSLREKDTSVIGTFLVELSCGCEIHLSDEYPIVSTPFPCFTGKYQEHQAPRINVVIPSRWANYNTTQMAMASTYDQPILTTKGYTFSEAFNDTWFKHDLVLNLSAAHLPNYDEFMIHFSNYHHIINPGMTILWLSVLSILGLYLFYHNWRLSQRLMVALSMIPVVRADDGGKVEHNWYLFLTMFGLLILMILVGLIICCCLFCVRKRKLKCVPVSPVDEIEIYRAPPRNSGPRINPRQFYTIPEITRPMVVEQPQSSALLASYLR